MSTETLPPQIPPTPQPAEMVEPEPHLELVDYEYAHGRVYVDGGRSDYTVAVPTGELASRRLVIYFAGLGAFKKTMRHVRNGTAQEDYAAASSGTVRESDLSVWQKLSDPASLHVDQFSAMLDDLPNNVSLRDGTENGAKLSFDQVDVVGHSFGGKVAVDCGLRYPGNIANLVLLKPVGHEEPGLHRVKGRLGPFWHEELWPFLVHHNPDLSIRDAGRALRHIWRSPLQTVGEIAACVYADHRDDLLPLGELMGVALITGEKDNLIPAEPIEEHSADMVHHYLKLETNHLGPQNEPRIIARAVTETIAELELQKAEGRQMPRLIAKLVA